VEINVLIEAQNGFRKIKSTDTVSHNFIENMQDTLYRGLLTIGLCVELSKAKI
jgi:hypothetical protein